MSLDQLDKDAKDLLLQFYRESGGDPSVQISMYEAGASLGLDREAASRATEDLIGWEMVELRTLSGGIGISDKAVKEIEDSGLGGPDETGALSAFGKSAVVDAETRPALEQLISDVKNRAGSLGSDFDRLSEVMTDLKTIDAQLDSPRPKTAIVRECFRSLKDALHSIETDEIVSRIGKLLEE